jgi:putative transposase
MSVKSGAKSFIRKSLDHKTHLAARFGATYFVTICCRDRNVNSLCHASVANAIFETAKIYHRQQCWYLILLLLMPDHLHAIVSVGEETSLSSLIGNFKRATAKFAGVEWQRNFFDHRLRHDESMESKAAYIRQNPLRAGLVSPESEWTYVIDRNVMDVAVR